MFSLMASGNRSLAAPNQAGLDDAEARVRIVVGQRQADGAYFAVALQVFERAAPLVAVDPLGVPNVQLQQVDGIQLEVAQTLFRGLDDVVVRKHGFDANTRAGGP